MEKDNISIDQFTLDCHIPDWATEEQRRAIGQLFDETMTKAKALLEAAQ